jgi:hypothetical protein
MKTGSSTRWLGHDPVQRAAIGRAQAQRSDLNRHSP